MIPLFLFFYSSLGVVRTGSPWTRSAVGVHGPGVRVFGLLRLNNVRVHS